MSAPGRLDRLAGTFLLLVTWLIASCSGVPRASEHNEERGLAIARSATQLVGTPYHFGGADARGFDCSGLVAYVHERAGLDVPRTADEQRRAAHPVPLEAVLPGDVVFFRTGLHRYRRGVNHVGIYAGDGRFIHAPRSGGTVTYASLREGYYRKHFVSAGRLWDAR